MTQDAATKRLRLRHGDARGSKKTSEYATWQVLKDRCLNPKNAHYGDYGGRGITVCPSWRDSFETFLADVGRRPEGREPSGKRAKFSLDRIDNERGYEPGNVRWATRSEQQRNTRRTRNITANGETKCLSEWAGIVGITAPAFDKRLKRGWTVEQAVAIPKGGKPV